MSSAADIRSASEQTRDRLLNAAREVFSECGFQGATVREICRRADANIAAVSYHFGSKDGLLAEALHFDSLRLLQETNAQADSCPEVRLGLFIHDFMHMLLDENNPSSQCRIMARELADPTPGLDKIVREAIAPLHNFFAKLVREIVGDTVDDVVLRRCVHSILGQCSFYHHSHPVLQRIHPELRYDSVEIDAIAHHITNFSLNGLRAIGHDA